jgi:geranylgeranyl pyrophosphate synthase
MSDLSLCIRIFNIMYSDIFVLPCRELTTEHQRLAEIIEMIHTASLIHDDVIDDSGMRRGV